MARFWKKSQFHITHVKKTSNKSCTLTFSSKIIETQNITLVCMLVENNKENSVNCTFVQILITADSGIFSENISGTSWKRGTSGLECSKKIIQYHWSPAPLLFTTDFTRIMKTYIWGHHPLISNNEKYLIHLWSYLNINYILSEETSFIYLIRSS